MGPLVWAVKFGPLVEPECAVNTQGPILPNPLEKARDHTGGCDYP